ncbi:MAG: LysR family transcriptional regulator [Alphaproteobacteria bacterium]|nr:LysR family transcriptional regulator [Alphaproteobacteria bacterium]
MMNKHVGKKPASAVPLHLLRAFEATARHMSMKEAAAELHLTPSAISYRVGLLEKILKCKLQQKKAGERLTLTEAGYELLPGLTAGFAQIINAVDGLRDAVARKDLT